MMMKQLAVIIFLLTMAYLINSTQLYIKMKMASEHKSWIKTLIPGNSFLKIILYMTLTIGMLMFTSIFILLSISASPVMGFLLSIFMGVLLVRSCLFVPGVVIGEMNFLDAFRYSLQTITGARAIKILLFGLLIFFMLSFIMSAAFYLPAIWFKSVSARMYFNFLTLHLQAGVISIGVCSLFMRYGHFEEEKMAE